MKILNIEIKARTGDLDPYRTILKSNGAEYVGLDHQVDTYFRANHARLKYRESTIQSRLVCYDREDADGPKQSLITLYECGQNSDLREVLTKSLGVLVVVDKYREIFNIGTVAFHLDDVKDLGTFVEIEAINKNNGFSRRALREQCSHYMRLLGIQKGDLVRESYSDLLLSGTR